jgi:CRISPR-associated protein Cmr6
MPARVQFVPGSGYECGGQRLHAAHRGLLLDKYMGVKPEKGSPEAKREGKKESQSRLPHWRALCEPGLTPSCYKLAFDRWRTYTHGLSQCVRFTGRVRGRMALGLGIESVQDIGCRLHATYGTPLIPGSGLKGALCAGLSAMNAYKDEARGLFGAPDLAGAVEVFDAWWMPDGRSSGLAPDVITVHHQGYYSGTRAPDDRESPVPNHFLTVTGSFYFVLRVRASGEGWEAFVKKLTQHFLSTEGIGAKRSAGYGRFELFADA